MPDDSTVLQELSDGVLKLTFNRPESHNGWTFEMESEYFGALADACANPDVRVIVVTGAGKSFCPGLDAKALDASSQGGRFNPGKTRWPMVFAAMIPKPVIAAVNGACAGIGLIQASAADVRFASTTAKFTTAFARRGLPAENGIAWLLARLLGRGVAADLLLSGRVVLAPEAKDIGLVNFLCEPDELLDRAMAYARDMAANCAPRSLAAMKGQLLESYASDLESARRQGLRLIASFSDHADFREGVVSYLEKRPPHFTPYSEPMYVLKEESR